MGEGGPDSGVSENGDGVNNALIGNAGSLLLSDVCDETSSLHTVIEGIPHSEQLSNLEFLNKTALIDSQVKVIPCKSQVSTPNSCESPPMYRELDLPCPSTSQCSAIRDDILVPINELPYLPYSHFSSSETCSLVLPVYGSKSNISNASSAYIAICRICHMPGDENEILISPCRCAGTLQFIHDTCLQRWLEIVAKKSRKPPKCELCHFQYNRHKKFKLSHLRLPKVSFQDKVLHIIFLINLLLMIGCAIATVMCFLSDKGQIRKLPRNDVELSTEEIITLACGVIFFVSFFVAMSVEIKARHTVYQLFVKFIMRNMEWKIDAYDRSKDSLYAGKNSCKNRNNNNNNGGEIGEVQLV